MTRVLQVLGRSAGGIAKHVAEITEALDGRDGLRIDVAGPRGLPVPMPKPLVYLDIPDGPVGHGGPIRRLRSLIADGGYEVVHAHGLRAGIDAGLAARKTSVTVVVTVHNLVRPEVAGRLKALAFEPAERMVVRLADKVLAVSRDIADVLSRKTSDDRAVKIEVMHLGVAEARRAVRTQDDVRAELRVPPGTPLVVTASRLSEQKALHVMIEAMRDVDATLAILGEGPLKGKLRDTARTAGVDDRVRFLGFRDDAADLIAAADVFCLSSVWEGVPLAVMEAVQLGTAVVATDVGGTGELIADRRSGRLVPPGEPAALADALRDVIGSPHLRAAYAEAALATLSSEFSTERMLARLAALYRDAG